jgi:hypothetical protein
MSIVTQRTALCLPVATEHLIWITYFVPEEKQKVEGAPEEEGNTRPYLAYSFASLPDLRIGTTAVEPIIVAARSKA